MKKNAQRTTGFIVALSVLFMFVAGLGLYFGSRYIDNKLLSYGKAMATDIALLVKNNFQITDGEVKHMKSLTFNEMEVDPINKRLMDVGNGVVLNAAVKNVYILAPLSKEEYRFCPDEESAEFLGFEMDEPLNGVWLLNGKIDEHGVFEPAQRDDIYRYTVLTETEIRGIEEKEPFGTFTDDAWGSFITGYAPIYTVEGNFVGLLGIDMDPDPYQTSAQHMIVLIIIIFALTVAVMSGLFIVFYVKYSKAREGEQQFKFYSKVSHEMRTPMNGIIGMAEVSKNETDISVLRENIGRIESSGKYLMELINKTLDYKNGGEPENEPAAEGGSCEKEISALAGKRLLLCEDNKINAEITKRMVENAGCLIEIAEDGKIGLEKFAASKEGFFCAVLMDIRMPVMDGIEAAKSIRALDRADAKTVPIIALTANSYEEDKQATKEAGMNAHLTKPVEPELLYKTIADTLTDRKSEPAVRG